MVVLSEQIDQMIFAYPKGWDGKVRGRYVRYHEQWQGSGKVVPLAGSFLGSKQIVPQGQVSNQTDRLSL